VIGSSRMQGPRDRARVETRKQASEFAGKREGGGEGRKVASKKAMILFLNLSYGIEAGMYVRRYDGLISSKPLDHS